MSDTRVISVDGVPVTLVGDIEGVKVVLNRTVKDANEIRIEVKKMAKGYQWEISASGPDPTKVVALIENVDSQLRQKFASEE